MYVCRVVGLRITREQDWPKGLEQLGTTWPDLDELSTYLASSPAQVSGYRNTWTASGHRSEF